MKQEITLREMLAYRPLVIAWVWELLCIAFAAYAMLVLENEMIGMAAIIGGVTPFGLAMLAFLQTRKKAAEGPDRSKDLVQ